MIESEIMKEHFFIDNDKNPLGSYDPNLLYEKKSIKIKWWFDSMAELYCLHFMFTGLNNHNVKISLLTVLVKGSVICVFDEDELKGLTIKDIRKILDEHFVYAL